MLQKGFSIVEWLIYFFLIMFLLSMVFTFVVSTDMALKEGAKTSYRCAECSAACDALVRDLQSAPGEKSCWKKMDQHECLWHLEDKRVDIGWLFQEGVLYRVKVVHKDGKKAKPKKNMVLRQVKECSFHYTAGTQFIEKVAILLQAYHICFEHDICVRNGVML